MLIYCWNAEARRGALPFNHFKEFTFWCLAILYNEKLSLFCAYQQKFSPRLFEGSVDSRQYKRAIHESFLREIPFFHKIAKVFYLERFPLYSTCGSTITILLIFCQRKTIAFENSNVLWNTPFLTYIRGGL